MNSHPNYSYKNGKDKSPAAFDYMEMEAHGETAYPYDFAQAEKVLKAMDALRSQALKTRIEEIVTMVDSAFRLLLTTYYSILRYEMAELSGTDME